jgi:hypothetical protein
MKVVPGTDGGPPYFENAFRIERAEAKDRALITYTFGRSISKAPSV